MMMLALLLAGAQAGPSEPAFTPALQDRLSALAACTAHAIGAMPKSTEANAAVAAATTGCTAAHDAVRAQLEVDLAARDHLSADVAASRVAAFMPRIDAMVAGQSLRYAQTYGGLTTK